MSLWSCMIGVPLRANIDETESAAIITEQGGSPGVEQHSRYDSGQRAPRLVWGDLFDAQRAAEHATDYGHLLELAQGLRPGQNIFRSGVSVLTQRADRDCGDVTLVDRGCRNGEIRPADDISGANLRRPPAPGIGGEHSGPQERPLES